MKFKNRPGTREAEPCSRYGKAPALICTHFGGAHHQQMYQGNKHFPEIIGITGRCRQAEVGNDVSLRAVSVAMA